MRTGLVLEPLPTGAWAFLTATLVVATKTLTFAQCFSAFCSDVIWLIVVSFFFAKVGTAAQSSIVPLNIAEICAESFWELLWVEMGGMISFCTILN